MNAVPADTTPPGALGWWARRAPWELVGLVGLALAIGSWLFALPALASGSGIGGLLANQWWHAWVVVWLMAVSVATRTIGLRDVVTAWLMGTFTVMLLVDLVAVPVMGVTGQSGLFVSVLVPFIEEFAKFLVLAGWVAIRWRRGSHQHGILDLAILGFAVGGGFGVHEDALAGRQVASGISAGGWGWLFPSFLIRPGQFAIAHAGWGALVGLGIGAASLYRHRVVRALVLAGSGLALAVIDHGAVNTGAGSWPSRLTGGGRVTAWVLLLGIVAALVFEVVALGRQGRLGLPLGTDAIRAGWRRAADPLEGLIAMAAVPRHHRARTAASFAHLVGRADQGEVTRMLNVWRRAVVGTPGRPG